MPGDRAHDTGLAIGGVQRRLRVPVRFAGAIAAAALRARGGAKRFDGIVRQRAQRAAGVPVNGPGRGNVARTRRLPAIRGFEADRRPRHGQGHDGERPHRRGAALRSHPGARRCR